MVERRQRIALLYISTHVVVLVVVVAFFHQMLGKTTLLQRPAAPRQWMLLVCVEIITYSLATPLYKSARRQKAKAFLFAPLPPQKKLY